ncbi:MAG: AraC family transcriptional regulator [Akkermansiaceae bacterium]
MEINLPHSKNHSEEVLQIWADVVRNAVKYIDSSLSEPLSINIIAADVGMSASQLRMIFSWFVGEGIGEYVRRRRLEKAALTIALTNETFTQVALDAGFESPAAFSRSFKNLFGVSPRGYRKKKPIPTAAPESKYRNPLMPDDVKVSESPAWWMAYRPMIGGNNYTVARTAIELIRWAEKRNLVCDPCKVVVRAFDDDRITSESSIRYDVGIQIPHSVAEEQGFAIQKIPARKVACAPFYGDAESHTQAWWGFGINWMMQSGYDFAELASYDFIEVKPSWMKNISSLLSSVVKRDWRYRTEMAIPVREGVTGSLAAPFPPPEYHSVS